jgi:DNA invertase Pin-like site-specific DNA recombinase
LSENDQVVGQSFTEDGREIRVFGYARVSTEDQNLDMQIRALEEYGCFKIFQEKRSAYATVRPELEKMKLFIQEDDTVVVWKLDRLGRSVSELIELMSFFDRYNVNFVSLRDMIDTRTAIGKFIFHIMASLAQFERDLTSERTIAGMEAAKARGSYLDSSSAANSPRADLRNSSKCRRNVATEYPYFFCSFRQLISGS